MDIKTAKKQLEELKDAILADGKVDLTEVNVLLDFVESYIANDKFFKFKQTLLKCKEDGKITEDESKLIIKEIRFLLKFLTVDEYVEKSLLVAVAASAVWYLAYLMFFS